MEVEYKKSIKMIELSKTQKKIARELIQNGLLRECKSFTEEIAKFTNSLEWETENPHDLYLKLYKKVDFFDEHIAKRYNNLTGSHYLFKIIELLQDEVLTVDDAARFDTEVQDEVSRIINTLG